MTTERIDMAQLKEASAVVVAGPDLLECPFDCGHRCRTTNEFERAQAFGDNVRNGVRSARAKQNANGDYEDDLSTISGVPEPASNVVFPNDWGWAAHHLIPVGTLKKHRLIRYLDKQANGSVVSCNAGYNVNGVNNAVWLIGSGKKQAKLKNSKNIVRLLRRAGIKQKGKQTAYSAMSKDAKENPLDPMAFRANLFATMEIYARQFHDSHDPYDDFVAMSLNKINANLWARKLICRIDESCKDKKEKPKAPHQIAARLDDISERLKNHLLGHAKQWKNPVFTSAYAKMFATEVQ